MSLLPTQYGASGTPSSWAHENTVLGGRFSVGWIDVGQGRVERTVPKVLADQKGIGSLLNHQHRRGVL